MRIFFITSKLNFRISGGSVEEFDLIVRTLAELGNNVTAVTIFSNMNDIPKELPYKVIEENITAKHLLGIQKGVYKILKKYEGQADFFHIDGHLCLYGAGLYRRLRGKVPISAFFNRELICWPPDRSTLFFRTKEGAFTRLKRTIRWCIEKYIGMPIASGIDLRFFISPMYQELYEDFGLSKSENNLVIGDPMDFKKIMQTSGVIEHSYRGRSERSKKNDPLIIFYSSRMAPGKGFDGLLMGFSKVKNKDKFRLILGGDGPEKPLVRKMIKDLKLEPYVDMPGWVAKEELYNFLKRADIFIQADWRFEGTSMSLLYAMAFGIPSILPAGGGLQWNAKGSAFYFKYKDWDDLARKIEQLGDNYELRNELSRQCYLRLSDDQMNFEKQIMRIYEGMKHIVQI